MVFKVSSLERLKLCWATKQPKVTYNNLSLSHSIYRGRKTRIDSIEQAGTLVNDLISWLERTPFLKFNEYNFLKVYKDAVNKMIEKEQNAIKESKYLSEQEKDMRLKW